MSNDALRKFLIGWAVGTLLGNALALALIWWLL